MDSNNNPLKFPSHWVAVGAAFHVKRVKLPVDAWTFTPLTTHNEVAYWFARKPVGSMKIVRVFLDLESVQAAVSGTDGLDPLFVKAAENLLKYVAVLNSK